MNDLDLRLLLPNSVGAYRCQRYIHVSSHRQSALNLRRSQRESALSISNTALSDTVHAQFAYYLFLTNELKGRLRVNLRWGLLKVNKVFEDEVSRLNLCR